MEQAVQEEYKPRGITPRKKDTVRPIANFTLHAILAAALAALAASSAA